MNINEEINKKFEEIEKINQETKEYNKNAALKIQILKEEIAKDSIKINNDNKNQTGSETSHFLKSMDSRVKTFNSYIEKAFKHYDNSIINFVNLSSPEKENFYNKRKEELKNAKTCYINDVEYKLITDLVDFCFWFKKYFCFCGYCFITDNKERHFDICEKYDEDGCPNYEDFDSLALFFKENIKDKDNIDKMYLNEEHNIFIIALKNKEKYVFHTNHLMCKVKDIMLPKEKTSFIKRILSIFN